MIRPHWCSTAAAVTALTLPALAGAHETPREHAAARAHAAADAQAVHAFAFGHDDDLEWAIVSDHDQSMSGGLDSDLIDVLKERHGVPFVVIGEKGDRYVITDEALVERAQRAAREIQKYGREIGEIARTQARLSLGDARLDRRLVKLEKRRKGLERSIRERERDGESAEDLEQELFQVKVAIDALEGVERSFALSSDEKDDLAGRRDVARKRLRRGVDRIRQEMRDILNDAKSRDLAEPLD